MSEEPNIGEATTDLLKELVTVICDKEWNN